MNDSVFVIQYTQHGCDAEPWVATKATAKGVVNYVNSVVRDGGGESEDALKGLADFEKALARTPSFNSHREWFLHTDHYSFTVQQHKVSDDAEDSHLRCGHPQSATQA